MTRTYVRYFRADQADPLADIYQQLADDWEKRRVHVSFTTRDGGDYRLSLLKTAINLLVDRVPE